MTNIYQAFVHLEKLLMNEDENSDITVIFISDGQHNSGGDIYPLLNKLNGNHRGIRINFICLGVRKQFPTKISMILKEKYHTGDPGLPAIFLIEHSSEKAF